MLLQPKKHIIYGPVLSRRLGHSLGINLMPAGAKVCPFNCVYCQYGWTTAPSVAEEIKPLLPKPHQVQAALDDALRALPRLPDFITFSGNGEPSAHPEFGEIVDIARNVRDRLAPRAETAILSNSALVTESGVREALARLDMRIMKLDCGTEGVFQRFNQPRPGLGLEDIIQGLAGLSRSAPVTIQAMFVAGEGGNFSEENIAAWIERLKMISPTFVQIYSLDRGAPAEGLVYVGKAELDRIRDCVRQAGFGAESYGI